MSVPRVILWGLLCAYLVLWVGGVGSHALFGGPPVDAFWAAPAFLLLAGVIVMVTASPSELWGLLAVGVLGFAAEYVGVRYGFLFGRYSYTAALRPQMFGVPLVMASAWMVLAGYVRQMLLHLRLSKWVRAIVAGAWMTAIDLVIDPLAANQLGYWRWAESGGYYGIPARNFVGWFGVSLFIFGVVRQPSRSNVWARYVGLSIVLFFTLIALVHHLLLAASIGFGLCLLHLALAGWAVRSDWQAAQ